MNRLDYFANYCKDVNVDTPQKLYEAIEKRGPLPRVVFVGTGSKRPSGDLTTNKDDIKDKEAAEDEAKEFYDFLCRIATGLRNANPDLRPLPEPKADPFQNTQAIREWCIPQGREREPLTKKARLIYDKLQSLQESEAMTRKEVLDWLASEHSIFLDEGTFNKIRKELDPYGIKNKPRIGYYIRK